MIDSFPSDFFLFVFPDISFHSDLGKGVRQMGALVKPFLSMCGCFSFSIPRVVNDLFSSMFLPRGSNGSNHTYGYRLNR